MDYRPMVRSLLRGSYTSWWNAVALRGWWQWRVLQDVDHNLFVVTSCRGIVLSPIVVLHRRAANAVQCLLFAWSVTAHRDQDSYGAYIRLMVEYFFSIVGVLTTNAISPFHGTQPFMFEFQLIFLNNVGR